MCRFKNFRFENLCVCVCVWRGGGGGGGMPKTPLETRAFGAHKRFPVPLKVLPISGIPEA